MSGVRVQGGAEGRGEKYPVRGDGVHAGAGAGAGGGQASLGSLQILSTTLPFLNQEAGVPAVGALGTLQGQSWRWDAQSKLVMG